MNNLYLALFIDLKKNTNKKNLKIVLSVGIFLCPYLSSSLFARATLNLIHGITFILNK